MALPLRATVNITTMNLIGKPRITKMPVSELYLLDRPKLLGGANYVRRRRNAADGRRWWMRGDVKEFCIKGGDGGVREKGVWENVARGIEKSSRPQV